MVYKGHGMVIIDVCLISSFGCTSIILSPMNASRTLPANGCVVASPSSLSSFGHPLLLEELKQGNIIHIGHDLISSSFLLTYYVKCHRSVIQNSPISNTVKYKRLIYFFVDNKSMNY